MREQIASLINALAKTYDKKVLKVIASVALEISRADLKYKPDLHLQNNVFLESVAQETSFPVPVGFGRSLKS